MENEKKMNCPRCRQPLREGARFCTGCGLSTAEHKPHKETGDALEHLDTIEDARPPEASALSEADAYLGRVLDSKYELIARLGEGGMGAVYRARRLHIGDEVAVKVLRRDLVSDADAIARFRREARSAAIIRHANVVTIHDFGEARASGAPAYIVMELVRGSSLRDLLRSEKRFKPERAVALMRDICAGVGVAHREEVVHRDLKPDNVIVMPPAHEGERETAKVVDFGLAKLRDLATEPSLTRTGAVMGTPFYMSPEQCRGEELDARSDVYSLGAMLYEMLAGETPFRSNNIAGLISKHLHETPPALPSGAVPPALEAACLRALAKNADDRPADANAFRRELQAAMAAPAAEPQTFATAPARTQARAADTPTASTLHLDSPEKKSKFPKLAVAGLLALVVCVVAIAAVVAVRRARDKSVGREERARVSNLNRAAIAPAPQADDADGAPSPVDVESGAAENTATEIAPESAQETSGGKALAGKWTGTHGPMNMPATLVVKAERKSNKFSGVLEQNGIRVAVEGNFDQSSRRVSFKETRVLSGGGWSLGENTGELSADRRTMSGTGSDPLGAQFGITYNWSFSKSAASKE